VVPPSYGGIVEGMRQFDRAALAERVGFEPTVPETGTKVFETVAFNHSAISPRPDYSEDV
jgi:hypothetical protein